MSGSMPSMSEYASAHWSASSLSRTSGLIVATCPSDRTNLSMLLVATARWALGKHGNELDIQFHVLQFLRGNGNNAGFDHARERDFDQRGKYLAMQPLQDRPEHQQLFLVTLATSVAVMRPTGCEAIIMNRSGRTPGDALPHILDVGEQMRQVQAHVKQVFHGTLRAGHVHERKAAGKPVDFPVLQRGRACNGALVM